MKKTIEPNQTNRIQSNKSKTIEPDRTKSNTIEQNRTNRTKSNRIEQIKQNRTGSNRIEQDLTKMILIPNTFEQYYTINK